MKEGEHEEQIVYYKGKTYKIEAVKNRFIITDLSKKNAKPAVNFVFTPENLTWNLEKDHQLFAISRIEKDANGLVCVRVFGKDGMSKVSTLPEENIAWNTFARRMHFDFETTAQR